jgi:hypothetical protein
VPVPAASATTTFTPPTANIGIIPFPGDVFTPTANGTLIPVDPLSTPLSAPLFNLAGNALNLTWGQWSSASAKSYAWTVTHNGTTSTQFLITMSGLAPNGVYSLFYRTFGPDSNNALCPNVEPTVALTAAFPQVQKPDADSFTATSSGKGLFFASVPEDLLAAQQLQVLVIYHFNGQTYGPVTNQGESRGPTPTPGSVARATATTPCASSSSSRNELSRTGAGPAGNRDHAIRAPAAHPGVKPVGRPPYAYHATSRLDTVSCRTFTSRRALAADVGAPAMRTRHARRRVLA